MEESEYRSFYSKDQSISDSKLFRSNFTVLKLVCCTLFCSSLMNVCACVFVFIYVCMCVSCVSTCVYIYKYICVHVLVYVCAHAFWVHVYMSYVWIYIYTHIWEL